MKKIIKNFLKIFNLELVNKKYFLVIDKRALPSFQNTNEDYSLYYEGLNKSENVNTDNSFKQSRFLDLLSLVKIVFHKKIEGHFAEVGCWKGHSAYLISKLISKYLVKNKEREVIFHIFDSFEGLSEITEKDSNIKKLDINLIKNIKKQFISNDQFVRNKVLKNFDFVKTYKGWIPLKFQEVENTKFSFVHIDLDLYEPTKKSLEFFFPRLNKGGIVVCDDYNSMNFNGAKTAWDEFFLENEVAFKFSPSIGSSFIIK